MFRATKTYKSVVTDTTREVWKEKIIFYNISSAISIVVTGVVAAEGDYALIGFDSAIYIKMDATFFWP